MSTRFNLTLLAIVSVVIALPGCGGGSGRGTQSLGSSQTLVEAIAENTTPTIPMALFGGLQYYPENTWQRYSIYVGGQECKDAIRAFKRKNRNAKVFLYQIAAAATDAEWARTVPNDPIGFHWIDKNRPEWFLLDSQGRRITFVDYPSIYAVDPGNEEYQRMWAENAIRRAKSVGADGIKIDGVGYRWDWCYNAAPAKYPTVNDFAVAMTGFVRKVVPQIRQAGLLVIGNGAGEPWNEKPWSDWINYFDGREYENEPKYESESDWCKIHASYAAHPNMIYVHYLPNPERYPEVFRFKVASFLLWMGPNSYASCGYGTGAVPIHDPLLDIRIGRPTSQCIKVGNTTYRRTFEYGEVILNISSSASETVQIGPGLRDVSQGPVPAGSYTLAPHQSLILSKS